MVHGGVHGSWAFENIGPRLAGSGWHGVALNWLNHHGSASLPLDVALQRPILDVGHEIGVVAGGLAQPPVLLAHSMGGLAALAYAAQNPVAGLVLLAPVVPREFAGEAIDVPYDKSALRLPPPGVAAPLFWDEVPAGHAERYTALKSPESQRAVIEATRWAVELDVSTVTAPSLLFGAERDLLVPRPRCDGWRRRWAPTSRSSPTRATA